MEDILLQVNKPARYIGQEWNAEKKDFSKSAIKFALGFPDLYEVGMSNLGLRIIYGILNSIPDVVCERFFACSADLESILRQQHKDIFSLESGKPLKDFDIVGFSLGSELGYTNVLNILDLGNIPLKSSLRDSAYPLIIAGGPSTVNPEPMHEFFDLFAVGEGEDLIIELINIYRSNKEKYRANKISKQELLLELSKIEGVYVPSFYEAHFSPQGQLQDFRPKVKEAPPRIKKGLVKDLDSAFFPVAWLIPYIQIIHDRIGLEIMRGCPNRCRFCQARSQYFPFRKRSIENILNLAESTYKKSGYEEISLCGLSVSDYPQMEELLPRLIGMFKERAVAVSLPSLKAKALVGNLSSAIASIKKTGLTLAPEAGSERLRQIIAKDFNEQEFFTVLEQAYAAGYQHVKLYFMIGFPSETQEDLDSIIDFAVRVSESRRKVNGRPAQVNISINALIPKPHTPFQWLAMEGQDAVKQKQEYLRDKAKKNRRLKITFHNRHMSFLEAVLSRGDRRLSQVILRAFESGARFDAWGDHFCIEKWLEAFKQSDIEADSYLRERKSGEALPWDFIDIGIDKETLLLELNKSIAKMQEAMYNLGTSNKLSI